MTGILTYLHVPSFERLDLDLELLENPNIVDTETLDAICHKAVKLRHLTLRDIALTSGVPALLSHLKHLETLTIKSFQNVNQLLIALSSHNPDSSPPCPYLTTVDIPCSDDLEPDVLVNFVQQRVKSYLDDPTPGLVTYLKLRHQFHVHKLCSQLVKTHSSSILFLQVPYVT